MRLTLGAIIKLDLTQAEHEQGDILLTFWDTDTPDDRYQTVMHKDELPEQVMLDYIRTRQRSRGAFPGRSKPPGVHVEP